MENGRIEPPTSSRTSGGTFVGQILTMDIAEDPKPHDDVQGCPPRKGTPKGPASRLQGPRPVLEGARHAIVFRGCRGVVRPGLGVRLSGGVRGCPKT